MNNVFGFQSREFDSGQIMLKQRNEIAVNSSYVYKFSDYYKSQYKSPLSLTQILYPM